MSFIPLLLFVGIPVLEISMFISVGTVIGLGPTLAIVIATAIIGAVLVKKQGLKTLFSAKKNLRNNQLPIHEFFDGLILIVAGLFLITPGFVTDSIGLLLFLPQIKMFLKNIISNLLVARTAAGVYTNINNTEPIRPTNPTIDGEFETVDQRETAKQKTLK
jgi:UPF0716 protein FxsA